MGVEKLYNQYTDMIAFEVVTLITHMEWNK